MSFCISVWQGYSSISPERTNSSDIINKVSSDVSEGESSKKFKI